LGRLAAGRQDKLFNNMLMMNHKNVIDVLRLARSRCVQLVQQLGH
jgi:hypothetical protein